MNQATGEVCLLFLLFLLIYEHFMEVLLWVISQFIWCGRLIIQLVPTCGTTGNKSRTVLRELHLLLKSGENRRNMIFTYVHHPPSMYIPTTWSALAIKTPVGLRSNRGDTYDTYMTNTLHLYDTWMNIYIWYTIYNIIFHHISIC